MTSQQVRGQGANHTMQGDPLGMRETGTGCPPKLQGPQAAKSSRVSIIITVIIALIIQNLFTTHHARH